MTTDVRHVTPTTKVTRPLNLDERSTELWERFEAAGQGHVFRFWDDLESSERTKFLEELAEVDLALIGRLVELSQAPSDSAAQAPANLEPAEVLRLASTPSWCSREEASTRGEELLGAGKVGIFLVAGGQGSRLGFEGPKGSFPVGELSNRTLFELHAQKLCRLSRLYGQSAPWYIMTSAANDAATREFFAENDHFGLDENDVVFLEQVMLPAVDANGLLVLRDRGHLFLSPNGHGGSYGTFVRRGGLEDARRRGLEHLFYFQVDNPLIQIPDETFVGLHDLCGSAMSLKVLQKTGPGEKIGVVGLRDGEPAVIEYSDLPPDRAEAVDENGNLLFGFGSIGIHAFSLDFFARVGEGDVELPYHLARKELAAVGPDGNVEKIPGVKFETFVFDAIASAGKVLHVECAREREFAPVKNRDGVDSLDSARELLDAEFRRWLRAADVDVQGRVEIAPLVAIDEAEATESLAPWKGQTFAGDVRFERDEDGTVSAVE